MPQTLVHGHPQASARRTLASTVASALAGLLLALAIAVGGAPAPAAAYDEDAIVAMANQERAANGLGGLVHNGALDAVALQWANQMATSGALSHNPWVGEQIPGGWTSWGENVAQGYSTGADVHAGWMGSPGHRANILGAFTDVGVALISAGGTTWAVQVFATYAGNGVAAAAPAAAPAPAPAVAPAPAAAMPTPGATPSASAPMATSAPIVVAAPALATVSAATAPEPAPWWPWLIALILAAIVAALLLPPAQRLRRRQR